MFSTGHLAALNQNFERNFLFGATKCPEKYFRNLSVMSLFGLMTCEYKEYKLLKIDYALALGVDD